MISKFGKFVFICLKHPKHHAFISSIQVSQLSEALGAEEHPLTKHCAWAWWTSSVENLGDLPFSPSTSSEILAAFGPKKQYFQMVVKLLSCHLAPSHISHGIETSWSETLLSCESWWKECKVLRLSWHSGHGNCLVAKKWNLYNLFGNLCLFLVLSQERRAAHAEKHGKSKPPCSGWSGFPRIACI